MKLSLLANELLLVELPDGSQLGLHHDASRELLSIRRDGHSPAPFVLNVWCAGSADNSTQRVESVSSA